MMSHESVSTAPTLIKPRTAACLQHSLVSGLVVLYVVFGLLPAILWNFNLQYMIPPPSHFIPWEGRIASLISLKLTKMAHFIFNPQNYEMGDNDLIFQLDLCELPTSAVLLMPAACCVL